MLTNAGAEAQDAFLSRRVGGFLEPLPAVVVCAKKPMSSDMPVWGKLGERPFELLPREVKGVVVDALARILQSLQQQVYLAEVPGPQN